MHLVPSIVTLSVGFYGAVNSVLLYLIFGWNSECIVFEVSMNGRVKKFDFLFLSWKKYPLKCNIFSVHRKSATAKIFDVLVNLLLPCLTLLACNTTFECNLSSLSLWMTLLFLNYIFQLFYFHFPNYTILRGLSYERNNYSNAVISFSNAYDLEMRELSSSWSIGT